MTVLPLGEVKSHLSELVGRVHDHHERVTVTVHGRPSAVLVAPEDLRDDKATGLIRLRAGAGRFCLSGGTCRDDAATPVEVRGDAASAWYVLRTTPTVRRALSETLPEAVAVAAYEFMTGPLLADPYRVGKRLLPPLDDRLSARRGTYRIIYRVDDRSRVVTVVDVAHR